jgi:predicted amidohydrolase YtcJ
LFDPSLYPGEPPLTRAILDQVAPDNPVLVMNASMHYLYANSAALAAANINDQTQDPPGGSFGRVDGKLNGIIGEASAMMMTISSLPKPTAADLATGINTILSAAASQGVTSLREAATGTLAGIGELALLHQLNGARRLPTRVSTAQFAIMAGKTPTEVAAEWAAAGVTPFSGDEMVRADAWKIVSDGSNQGRSGYLLQPYLGEDNGGKANWTPETMRDALKVGLDGGWQLMVHTNGDGAVEFALEALEDLLPSVASNDLRHRLEHVSLTTDDQLARMAKLGLSPSFLMNHVYYWGAAFRDTILGAERTNRLDRVASAYAAGMRPSLHSDYNVSKIQPLLSARTAVLRATQADGAVLNAAECATAQQALDAVTRNAAWQIHADDRGSLEVGKRADFAVASANPWSTDPSAWADITFTETYIDGTPAWQS